MKKFSQASQGDVSPEGGMAVQEEHTLYEAMMQAEERMAELRKVLRHADPATLAWKKASAEIPAADAARVEASLRWTEVAQRSSREIADQRMHCTQMRLQEYKVIVALFLRKLDELTGVVEALQAHRQETQQLLGSAPPMVGGEFLGSDGKVSFYARWCKNNNLI